MPGAKPKVKGKKRKSIGGTPDDERAPAPSTAAAKGKGKSKKAMEDGDGGSEPVDDRFAKLPSFDVELDSDLDEDPVDEDDDFDEATWLDHEDDVSDDDDEGGDSDDDGNEDEDEKRADREPTPDEVKAAYDSDFDIDGDGDGDDADAGGAMDPAEPELFEFGDDDTAGAGGKKVLSEKALKKARADQAKRGVVYLGSIPPFMKPQKLRQLLTPYGDLDRMYLMPEDPEIRARRKKFKGNTGKNFVEGWVEFRDKKKAKACAAMLNGTQVGGRRRGAHFSDLWNMKYLPKFKWDNLTEEIEYQKALREQRMQLELSVAKKERDFYLQKVEQAKQIEKMRERRAAEAAGDLEKLKHLPEAPPEDREETKEEYEARMRRERARQKEERNQLLRRFKQREALGDINVDSARGMMSVDVLRDLFAGKKPDDE
jgi:ESF2/ABP1 family protein|tara:strand:- start:1437 stop:2720 length:1284 start_codon:yes stop_codon:yes gene_type:complete